MFFLVVNTSQRCLILRARVIALPAPSTPFLSRALGSFIAKFIAPYTSNRGRPTFKGVQIDRIFSYYNLALLAQFFKMFCLLKECNRRIELLILFLLPKGTNYLWLNPVLLLKILLQTLPNLAVLYSKDFCDAVKTNSILLSSSNTTTLKILLNPYVSLISERLFVFL